MKLKITIKYLSFEQEREFIYFPETFGCDGFTLCIKEGGRTRAFEMYRVKGINLEWVSDEDKIEVLGEKFIPFGNLSSIPWRVEKSPNDPETFCVTGPYLVADNLPIEDARLIAAAPDLLEACKSFVAKVDSGLARSVHSYNQMKFAIEQAINSNKI